MSRSGSSNERLVKIYEQRQFAITLKPLRLKRNNRVKKLLLNEVEAAMLGDPKTNEWSLLKDQFDALVHEEGLREDSIESVCDDQIRRRFAEWINRAAECNSLIRA